ncbi:MAG: Gldg family protein [Planctomycetaceae bacterium]|nr:Gldg family protein [Planctomycetaceae bacterium]
MIRTHVILAVAKRNFRSYFSGVLGYLFITVFCVASAAMAFSSAFFAANSASLDQLTQAFPWLLLFVIPAITMTTWADERKLGTDELLFTLPSSEVEILLGKYLAVFAVYSVALLFSLVNVVVLFLLGSPDTGAVVSSYAGYWFAGGALLSAGMLASALTNSATVSFVMGVVFCCVPVLLYYVTDVVEWLAGLRDQTAELYELRNALAALSLQEQLRDFSVGVVPITGVAWFSFFSLVMLYLNFVVISKRRWGVQNELNMSGQYFLRTLCLVVTCGSLLFVFWHYPVRADLSSERLFTLSAATRETLSNIKSSQQITIQAFISPEVPADYVETRRQLIGLLREFKRSSGGAIDLREVSVEPFSDEGEQARALGIEPVRLQYDRDGKREEAEIFMGAFLQSASDEIVIPFFGKGLPIEYELTRSLRTVSQEKRLKVGVLLTDAKVMTDGEGGGKWEIVRELEKQFDVIAVNPSQKILKSAADAETKPEVGADSKKDGEEKQDDKIPAEGFDVLLAIMPSSLTQPQMDNFVEYVKAGKPTLIFDDPCPYIFQNQSGLVMAPRLPKQGGGGMFGGPPPEQKADNGELTALMSALNVKWDNGQITYDRNNPHTQFATLPPEYVFISRTGNKAVPFSEESDVTKSLQDLVMLFPGSITDRAGRKEQKFTPLLRTSTESGLLDWEDFTSQSFNPFTMSPGVEIKQNPRRRDDGDSHVIAAHIRNETKETPLNVIFCSDIDMITDWFFMERNRGMLDIQFDNVTFVLNAVDQLAGDETFIPLRSRREKMRTLQFVEERTSNLRKNLNKDEKEAQDQMDSALKKAEDELRSEIKKIQDDQGLDERSKEVMVRTKEEQLNRQLEIQRDQLERDLNAQVRKSALEMKRKVRQVENTVKIIACMIPAILPICFGMLFLGIRNLAEQQSINPNRRRT